MTVAVEAEPHHGVIAFDGPGQGDTGSGVCDPA
jgi:hypothetical protein